ncbi:YjgN family protein [Thalassotalea ponticola]|uniref:YjgN family protein n=1 Tax=Thalassotalea ponticola TaxID=1523392 RepID=UPI0025B3A481|nr:YjgN family protein [Thalassotalea ponticola]MDN3653327.1 YjgN family protein [Thalassotalea ponticola]
MDIEQNNTENLEPTFTKSNFSFHGNAVEFFGIWIVNVLLTIVTLGIYSAWAKVRTNRYIHGNTEVDGHRFDYLATPWQILKGRLIAVAIFALYWIVSTVSPVGGVLLGLGFLFLTPFLICSSMRFKMRMSSYRNVRFDFTGRYGQAAINFILLPVLSVFTLYLLLPWAFKRIDQFIVSNTKYGNKQFDTNLSTGTYYEASLLTLFIALGVGIVFFVALAMFGLNPEMMADQAALSGVMTFVIFAVYIIFFTFIQAFYKAMIRNHIFASSKIDGVAKFDSHFTFSSLAFLQLTNLLALIFTFGLAYPWTRIRSIRYNVNRTDIYLDKRRQLVFDDLEQSPSATTDEIANVFDVDVALT